MQENRENITKIIQRLSLYVDNQDISFNQIANKIGVSNSYFSKMVRNDGSLGEDVITKILLYYDNINPEWLLTGHGPMLREELSTEIVVNRLHQPPYREKMGNSEVPLYNIDAAANLRTLFDNKHQNIIDSLKIPDLPSCDGAIYIRGDSMYPLLKAGDIVIYKEISDFSHLIFGEIYLIDYNLYGDDYLVIKYVKRSQIKGHIQLVSYNQHHDPIDIPVQNCIRAMALVKASVRLNMMI